MKRLYVIVLTLFFGSFAFAQNTFSIDNITNNSVTLNYSVQESTTVGISELLFEEDFANFPITSSAIFRIGTPICLPNSYTKTPNSRGRYIYHNSTLDGIVMQRYSEFTPSEFFTPSLFLESGKSYNVYVSATQITSQSRPTVGVTIDKITGNTTTNILFDVSNNITFDNPITIIGDNSSSSFRFYISVSSGSQEADYNLKNIKIESVAENVVLSAENQNITINNLAPNRKYIIKIDGINDIVFSTAKDFSFDSIQSKTNTATIGITNNTSDSKKLKVVKKQNTTLAKDLFISQVLQSNMSQTVEIYNGTGEKKSLGDYKIVVFQKAPSVTANVHQKTKSFSITDSIDNNSTIILTYSLEYFRSLIDTKFYCLNFGTDADTTANSFKLDGNDAIVLMHNNDTIDIFGNVSDGVANTTGWTDTDIQTAKTILQRKTFVNKGIRQNPAQGFPTLAEEWTQIGEQNSTNEEDFADFGSHTMTGALTNADIENINSGTAIATMDITTGNSTYEITGLDANSIYVAYLLSQDENTIYDFRSFRTKSIIQRTASGNWNDTNWTIDMPSQEDVVVMDNYDVVVPEGFVANCYSITLQDNGTNKATLKNDGTLNVEDKIYIEQFLQGYGNDTNACGWNLVGIPIDVTGVMQNDIATTMNASVENNDMDLYSWNEAYNENGSQGIWYNYKVHSDDANFFENGKGYLLAYSTDRTNTFSGTINNNSAYTLLSNASLSTPTEDRGWHLVANPYSFNVKVSNLTKNNCTNPSILNSSSGNYEVLSVDDFIKAGQGFMVQVADATNALTINKNVVENKTTATNPALMCFEISSALGNDVTKIGFDTLASYFLDWQTDNHKLEGLGYAPEIATRFGTEKFAINVIPFEQDTILVDLDIRIKQNDTYAIRFNGDNTQEFTSIFLCDKNSDEELADLLIDSVYTFSADENFVANTYYLKMLKSYQGIENPNQSSDFITLQQDKRTIGFISNKHIKQIEVYNVNGHMIETIENKNQITLQQQGVFILKAKTDTTQKVFKVVAL